MRIVRLVLLPAVLVLLVSCGGGNGSTGPGALKIEKWPPSGDNQTDTVGQTLPKVLRAKVTVDGQVAAGHMVHFDGGDLGTDSMVTGSDGIATSSWTLSGQVGTQFVTVTLDGATGSPLVYHATAVTGAAAVLNYVSGDGQIVGSNAFFFSPLVGRVVDQFGNGVAGRWVHFTRTGPVVLGADSILTGTQGDYSLNVQGSASTGNATITANAGALVGSPLLYHATVVDTIVSVDLSDTTYSPANVTIPAGSAVRWVWSLGTHTVTPDTPGPIVGTADFTSPHIYGPVIFDTAGVYTYHCTVHAGMTGTITVN